MKYSQSAFPYILNLKDGSSVVSKGMTLRDYFAAQAMQGMMVDVDKPSCDYIAETAYEMADAMLKAREQ